MLPEFTVGWKLQRENIFSLPYGQPSETIPTRRGLLVINRPHLQVHNWHSLYMG